MIPEVITIKLDNEIRPCETCGGWGSHKPLFRGINSSTSPVDYGTHSPSRKFPDLKKGTGKCKVCKGEGQIPVWQARRDEY